MRWLLLCVFANALTPKLCIHCKHFKPNNLSGPEFGRCGALPTIPNFVTGKIDLKDYSYCSIARNNDKLCGNSGKLFEQLDTDLKHIGNAI